MAFTQITLPCTARELEGKIHAFCDHHGFDCSVEVVLDERNLPSSIVIADKEGTTCPTKKEL